jgi:hypothetical protein
MTYLDELWIIYWLCRSPLYTDRKWQTQSLIRCNWFTLMSMTQPSQTPIKNPRERVNKFTTCVVSNFHRQVHDICNPLGYYAAYNGNSLSTFRDNQSFPSSRVNNYWPLKMGPTGCPETSAKNDHFTLRILSQNSTDFKFIIYYNFSLDNQL